jgi:Flp pilus assembly protein TadG
MSQCRRQAGAGFGLRLFGSDIRGGAVIMFGLALVPVMGMLGVAVDVTHACSVRTRMGQASDAAAVAAVNAGPGTPKAERDRVARHVFDTNMEGVAVADLAFAVMDVASGLRVEATANVKNHFLPVVGVNQTTVGVVVEVENAGAGTDATPVADAASAARTLSAARR